ncbi:MAG: glycine betaine/proline transport system substrate-binding protein [Granulosicoccus sp.]|jgi:glycine betaine/proline transport system substrate-binding protein
MHSKKFLAISCATAISAYGTVAQAADVVIGVPNWPSVLVTAHVLKIAMENNLGLEVELQNGTNPVVFEAMDSGSMHVHPEVWMPNQVNLNKKYVVEKKTVRQNPNGVAGDQAMCVTKGTAERTGIVNLSDLTDPEMAKNFDTDGDGMGEIWIGAAGWASTPIEKIRAKSYGYDATMKLKEIDESLALAEVDSAVTKGENITFFCYTPHHMFALHDLVILKEPAHDPAQWNVIQPTDDPEWLSKSTAGVAWSSAYLHIHYAASLETDQPEAAAMLSKVALDTATVSAMTYALVVEEQDPATFAAKWVEDNAEIVDSWLQ